MNNAFRTLLEWKLQYRETAAQQIIRGALADAGFTEHHAQRVIETTGKRMTWLLWGIAVDEAESIVGQ